MIELEFKQRGTVKFCTLEPGSLLSFYPDSTVVWIKTTKEQVVCVNDGDVGEVDADYCVYPKKGKLIVE